MAFMDTQPAPLGDIDGLDPYAAFRVDATREIIALLRELNETGSPVQLSAPGGAHMSTVIWSVDVTGHRISMRAEPDDPQLSQLIDANEATAVAYLEAVKLQFDVNDLVLVRGARACALQARMPQAMHRFQRRQAFRVRPQMRTAPTAVMRHPAMPDMQLALRVLDVSIGGCSLLLPDDVPPLAAGGQVRGVVFELSPDAHFVATLQVHHVTSIRPDATGVRLGCEFVRLGADHERMLQRYIDQTQKRHRLLSLS
ncbi:flagellar brake protein [Ideonella sp. A 288]|uniref:flagellar brake protein n=1 Tax=Ideonella sp. A 288 TaxID=1962181 RepID=UPI000B4B05C3|nr:flagellar brake protein [Ideonella sp. A 288]